MNRLQGKTAVITGGNSGVGAAAAILFASEGANVVISARRQNALDEVAEKIKAAGGNVLTVPTDISKDGDCKALMKAAADKFGKIDILINNAGVLDTGLKAIDKYLDDDAEKVIAINEVGTMQCIRAALGHMESGASIVNVARSQATTEAAARFTSRPKRPSSASPSTPPCFWPINISAATRSAPETSLRP